MFNLPHLINGVVFISGCFAGNTNKFSKVKEQTSFLDLNFKHDGVHHDEDTSIKLASHRSSDTPVMHEWDTNVESLMPKLQHFEYYTQPSIQDLAAKERAEPGFCCCVKDFVVGHYRYGYIKFPGETDVRQLDLESIIQFNNREVIVYMDESKKPPVGQGLNKRAEITLLNIKCLDKKTGKQCMDAAKVNKYRALLVKKAKDQGAEFVSFEPARGEWKFSVQHFSQ